MGVQRQADDCRAMAETLGWQVAGEYTDNDVSAYKNVRRPAYERLLADIEAGAVDGLIVYHLDRLTRRPMDLERFLEVIDAAHFEHVRFVSGDPGLFNGDGLTMARMSVVFANHESVTKSRRITRQKQEEARKGRPARTGERPFGYSLDQLEVVPDEAAVFREVAARLLAGENPTSLCKWLNSNGILTSHGGPWSTTTLRKMLRNPRYAGLRTYKGEVVATAVWPAIIAEGEHRRILAYLDARKQTRTRAPQSYLLTGLLRCGRCGNRLFSSLRQEGRSNGRGNPPLSKTVRRYVCMAGPDHGGCGRLTVVADPLEAFLAAVVLDALDGPDVARALTTAKSRDKDGRSLAHSIEQATAHRDELADLYATRQITAAEWMHARKPIEAALDHATRQLASLNQRSALLDLAGHGQQLSAQWGELTLSRQHAIVAAVIDHAVIGPGKHGARELDPERVQVAWKV